MSTCVNRTELEAAGVPRTKEVRLAGLEKPAILKELLPIEEIKLREIAYAERENVSYIEYSAWQAMAMLVDEKGDRMYPMSHEGYSAFAGLSNQIVAPLLMAARQLSDEIVADIEAAAKNSEAPQEGSSSSTLPSTSESSPGSSPPDSVEETGSSSGPTTRSSDSDLAGRTDGTQS